MVSLDSAKGPSDTTRFLPETILPSRSSGFPAMALPSSFNRLNHAIQLSAICCICSGERPLYQSVLRKISMYPFCDCVLILFCVDGCPPSAVLLRRTGWLRVDCVLIVQ